MNKNPTINPKRKQLTMNTKPVQIPNARDILKMQTKHEETVAQKIQKENDDFLADFKNLSLYATNIMNHLFYIKHCLIREATNKGIKEVTAIINVTNISHWITQDKRMLKLAEDCTIDMIMGELKALGYFVVRVKEKNEITVSWKDAHNE